MSRDSRAIWRAALGRAEDLPPCPNDMSEPLYAALVFDQHCFVSATTLGNILWINQADDVS